MSPRLSTLRGGSTSRVRSQAYARRRRQRLWALEGRVLLSGNPTIYTVTDASDLGSLILSFHP